ncbi:MAG: rod shape-determining protein RodA [Candidatus Eisenbacteria bacterium]|nr:rod shape-determining protein RodA [Candidatus Eisenbacteria bacterium]
MFGVPRIYRQRWDWILSLAALVLLVIGVMTVYSATHLPDNPRHGYFVKHFFYLFLGLVVFAVCLFTPLRLWEDWSYAGFGITLFFLLLVLLMGEEHYGAKRWFRAGPIKFQPSEMAKLAFAASFARFLAGKRVDLTQPRTLLLTLFGVGVPTLLVLKEPDLGTSGSFPGLAVPMMLWAGMPRLALFALVSPVIGLVLVHHLILWLAFIAIGVVAFVKSRLSHWVLAGFLVFHVGLHIAAPLVISKLHPYQQARIESFLNPEADPSGAGYQGLQSRIALGSGGVFGKGYLQGSQKALAYLPMQHNDFIFSVIGEEFGFVGAALVVLAFGTLVYRAIEIAKQARSPFASLLAVGIGGLVFYHASVNMAMTMGLFPVTGLPLPFVSYGGTFLLTMMAALGLLMNVAVHRFDY